LLEGPYLETVQEGCMQRVRLYTTTYCPWCEKARELLRSKRVFVEEIDVTGDEELRRRLEEMTGGRQTVPQVWIGGSWVGGYRELLRLEEAGRLESLLQRGMAEPGEAAIPYA
jgi:glutaredoxin 3